MVLLAGLHKAPLNQVGPEGVADFLAIRKAIGYAFRKDSPCTIRKPTPGTSWANPANKKLFQRGGGNPAAPFFPPPLHENMIAAIPIAIGVFLINPVIVTQDSLSLQYTRRAEDGRQGKTSLSVTWKAEKKGKENKAAWETACSYPDTASWYMPVVRTHTIFLESGERRVKEISFIWEKPSSQEEGENVGTSIRPKYVSVGGGDRELEFDWVVQPFSPDKDDFK